MTLAIALESAPSPLSGVVANANEFLTFTLGSEEYGVDILKVQEIRGYDVVTRLPDAPDYVKGVINLRGTIVPVIDLRLKFRLAQADYNSFTVMIILNIARRVMGIVVDGVSDVLELGAEQVRPPPEITGSPEAEQAARFITGLGTVGERMLILLDIEKLLCNPDVDVIPTLAAESATH